jgi:hypothetical protein
LQGRLFAKNWFISVYLRQYGDAFLTICKGNGLQFLFSEVLCLDVAFFLGGAHRALTLLGKKMLKHTYQKIIVHYFC